MYELQTQLTDKIAIAEGITLKNLLKNEILIPNNNAELIIPLDQDLEVKMVGTFRSVTFDKLQAYFLKPRGRGMELYGNASYLIIQLHSVYTRAIVKRLELFTNGVYKVDLPDRIIDELISLSTFANDYVLNELLERELGLEQADPNEVLMCSIDLIKESCGSITIKEIYNELSISKSTLEQRFNKDIGLTPKEFCKIQKLNCFIQRYKASKEMSLTELTYQCGYYDQSHLIKDFRYFLDMCPRDYFT